MSQMEEPKPNLAQGQSPKDDTDVGHQLQYRDQASLLDTIDRLALQGLRKYVSLPRIIVCGDQSSGKSSVLEAISHVRFPVKDTLCTTFATELIIRRTPSVGPSVSIAPAPSRSPAEQDRLRKFKRDYSQPEDLPGIIDAARREMETPAASSGLFSRPSSFFDDRLRIQICNPDWPPLTIIDLPGLIHSANDGQNFADVLLVRQLVRSHMEDPRSIILAVVSAGYDAANQAILSLAKEVDPDSMRTLGVITKPDTLPPPGSESFKNIIRLARNEPGNHHFKHGWHVLKNRSYEERNQTASERDAAEKKFFSQESWSGPVGSSSMGISSLRTRLSKLLHQTIVSSLPDVINEIRKGISETQDALSRLGPSRLTRQEKQAYLATIAQRYQALSQSAVDGTWNDEFFGDPLSDPGKDRHLRSVIQNLNQSFADVIAVRGHTSGLTDSTDSPFRIPRPPSPGPYATLGGPIPKWRIHLLERIEHLSRNTRGRELPGIPNASTIEQLFREQSSRWKDFAIRHIENVHGAVVKFVEECFQSLTEGRTYNAILCDVVDPALQARYKCAMEKLDEIITPYDRRHPISYHNSLLRHVKEARANRRNSQLNASLQKVSESAAIPPDRNELQTQLAKAIDSTSIDSLGNDQFECSQILDHVEAYYEVALGTFIDNVASLVVESCFIDGLSTLLAVSAIQNMEDESLDRLAAESEEIQSERQQLEKKLEITKRGLEICTSHIVYAPNSTSTARSRSPLPSTTSRSNQTTPNRRTGNLSNGSSPFGAASPPRGARENSNTVKTHAAEPVSGMFVTPGGASNTKTIPPTQFNFQKAAA
ncbi:MAG: hypothetical protein M1820_007484 [Bogoriella megaspora]|nr:MAG: hypothetical protein M1820_007484 [Bogoriella megaspora]